MSLPFSNGAKGIMFLRRLSVCVYVLVYVCVIGLLLTSSWDTVVS